MATTTIEKIGKGEKPENPVQKFSGFLDRMKPQLHLALPKHLNADRVARLALTQFSINPTLQRCDMKSIAGALMTSAQMGLEVGVNGQAYLVPYKVRGEYKATLVPGWRGLVDLVNRSGRATVWTGAVFDGDEFDYRLGDSPKVDHRPGDEDDPEKLRYVYAIGRVRGAELPVIEVWSMAKVWKHRDRFNKVGDAHYSFQHPEMYARKVPLLQVLKYMPSSIELAQAMSMAEAADSGEGIVIDADESYTISDAADPETGEIRAPAQQAGALSSYRDKINGATDAETAALVLDEARSSLVPDEQEALTQVWRAKWGPK